MSKKTHIPETVICVCTGDKCGKYSKEITRFLKDEIKSRGLKEKIEIFKINCTDRCKMAPVVCVQPANDWYLEATGKDLQTIVDTYLK